MIKKVGIFSILGRIRILFVLKRIKMKQIRNTGAEDMAPLLFSTENPVFDQIRIQGSVPRTKGGF